jgi:hypothetical protein
MAQLLGIGTAGWTLYFRRDLAFSSQLSESDSASVECVVGSMCPSRLRRLAPTDDFVTDYDRKHFQHYVRLLDARAQGLSAEEMCRAILDIDPLSDPEAARMTLKSHLDRAAWMTQVGFHKI